MVVGTKVKIVEDGDGGFDGMVGVIVQVRESGIWVAFPPDSLIPRVHTAWFAAAELELI